MTAMETSEALENFAATYSKRGFNRDFLYDKVSGNYKLTLSKDGNSATIRDGYIDGRISTKPREITSFDVLFTLEGNVFLKYISDYPLEEYSDHLAKAFRMIDAFFEGNYTVTIEKYMIFWKKNYLNIKVDGHEEHLLQTGQV